MCFASLFNAMYMKIFEKERMIREKGQKEGLKEGLKEGALGAIRMALSFGKDKSEVKSAVFEQFHIITLLIYFKRL